MGMTGAMTGPHCHAVRFAFRSTGGTRHALDVASLEGPPHLSPKKKMGRKSPPPLSRALFQPLLAPAVGSFDILSDLLTLTNSAPFCFF
jgi:hypothetical protein